MVQEEIKLSLSPEEVKQEQEEQLEHLENNQQPVRDPLADLQLSKQEQETVDSFWQKVDIEDANTVLQYGASAQKKVSDFSDSALSNIKTKDMGDVGKLITDLVVELKDSSTIEEEKKGFFASLFDKGKDSVERMKARFDDAGTNVDKIANALEDHQIQLLKDIALLDELYARNQVNIKEIGMYILAGRKKLQHANTVEMPKLLAKAKETGTPEDAQKANDYQQAIIRFEKKLHDLELTRQVAVQMAPQIRLVQNNDTLMAEKIQSTLVNTIPLWKNQIVLSLGISHSKQAIQAQQQVSEMTNTLLKRNAERLHQATVDTAKESERGIVDLETLQQTNQQLINTLDEVLNIQKEGRARREQASIELKRIENELTNKLMEIKQSQDVQKGE